MRDDMEVKSRVFWKLAAYTPVVRTVAAGARVVHEASRSVKSCFGGLPVHNALNKRTTPRNTNEDRPSATIGNKVVKNNNGLMNTSCAATYSISAASYAAFMANNWLFSFKPDDRT